MAIEISDATPVQFWAPDCATWNQQTPEGVHKYKFCQPWNCDDTIRVEFSDVLSDDTNYQEIDFPSLSTWLGQTGSGSLVDWSVGATPSVNLGAGPPIPKNSEILYSPYSFVEGKGYKMVITFTTNDVAGIRMSTYDSSFNIIQSSLANIVLSPTTLEFEFTATADAVYFGVQILISEATVSITERHFYATIPDEYYLIVYDEDSLEVGLLEFSATSINSGVNGLYSLSFVPEDLGICDEEIYLKIFKSTGTPDVEVAMSDGLDIKTAHSETVLLTYSNHTNFAGIYYQSVSPDQEFYIRIPATFFRQRMPQERESLQLSSNRVINLFGQTKIQKFLETGRMPFYMHLKVGLILQHQIILINDQYWVAEENYESIEPADKRDSLERYTIWLTQKQYVVRNIL
jgi:hypothetical protein